MNYIMISIAIMSSFILLIKPLLPVAYQTYCVVLACVLLAVSFIFQINIEAKRKPTLISSYHEEIEDFRDWKSEEATYRILGDIRRLSHLGVTKIDLNRCLLSGIHLIGLKMKNSNLNCVDLSNSYISDCVFEDVNFVGANLALANIVRSSFINCKIDRANFFDVILVSVDFKDSDLSHCDMSNNLDKARVIYDCKHINDHLLQTIQAQSPEILEKPTAEKMTRFQKNEDGSLKIRAFR